MSTEPPQPPPGRVDQGMKPTDAANSGWPVALPAKDVEQAHAPARMSEAQFETFYGATAAGLKKFLLWTTGNVAFADDVLQESYLRMLKMELPPMTEEQRRSYLYRTATNLIRDHHRSARSRETGLEENAPAPDHQASVHASADLQRVLSRMDESERQILWLAYAEGASHREIATVVQMKEASIRPTLYRIKQKLSRILGTRKPQRGLT